MRCCGVEGLCSRDEWEEGIDGPGEAWVGTGDLGGGRGPSGLVGVGRRLTAGERVGVLAGVSWEYKSFSGSRRD